MNRYQNGKIYTIRSHQTDKFYIGSTCLTLAKRFSSHKQTFKSFNNGRRCYVSSMEIIKNDDCYIELLEDCKCDTKDQLTKREGELIRLHRDKCVNVRIEGRTKKEYIDDNKERYIQYRKEYHLINKEAIAVQTKQYRETTKDNIAHHGRIYYEANKEKLSEQRKKPMTCECGSTHRTGDKTKHLKSKKHQAYILSVNAETP